VLLDEEVSNALLSSWNHDWTLDSSKWTRLFGEILEKSLFYLQTLMREHQTNLFIDNDLTCHFCH